MKKAAVRIALLTCTLALFTAPDSQAQIKLLAVGTLDQSRAGSFADLSGLTYTLETGRQQTRWAASAPRFATPPAILFLPCPTAARMPYRTTRISTTPLATSTDSTRFPWTCSPTPLARVCRLL